MIQTASRGSFLPRYGVQGWPVQASLDRFVLTDAQWAAIEPLCPGKAGDRGQTGGDGRLFVEAVSWIARTGSPWRDLLPRFGRWNSVYKRFRRWVLSGVVERISTTLSEDADFESRWRPARSFVSIVMGRAQTWAGRKRGPNIGPSAGTAVV